MVDRRRWRIRFVADLNVLSRSRSSELIQVHDEQYDQTAFFKFAHQTLTLLPFAYFRVVRQFTPRRFALWSNFAGNKIVRFGGQVYKWQFLARSTEFQNYCSRPNPFYWHVRPLNGFAAVFCLYRTPGQKKTDSVRRRNDKGVHGYVWPETFGRTVFVVVASQNVTWHP